MMRLSSFWLLRLVWAPDIEAAKQMAEAMRRAGEHPRWGLCKECTFEPALPGYYLFASRFERYIVPADVVKNAPIFRTS